jgi:hypothetical protein
MAPMPSPRRLAATALILGGSLFAGCGLPGCGSTFSAQEFVDQANEHGAGLELGAEITGARPGKKVYGVTLVAKPGDPVLPGTSHTEDSGSLSVYDDTGAANQGTRECEAGADLLCYQAGNVVIVLEAGTPNVAQTRLATALEAMAK